MARIRTIKPEFWTDSTMVQLPHFARLFYIALWTAADDHGFIRDEPERLAMELMPRENLSDVEEALQLLHVCGRLEWIVNDDLTTCYRIAKWTEHQKIDHPSKSKIFRDGSRKVAIPSEVRRAVANKYGCKPGKEIEVGCYYCSEKGWVKWFNRRDGKPSLWVVFSGLDLDHIDPEHFGGETVEPNLVLACRSCNRSKGSKHWFDFIIGNLFKNPQPHDYSRVLALEGKGKERIKEEERSDFSDRSEELSDSDCGIAICRVLCFSGIKLPCEIAKTVSLIRSTLNLPDNWAVFDFLPQKWTKYRDSTKYAKGFEKWLGEAGWKDGEKPRVNGKLPKTEGPYERTQRELREG